MPKDFQHRPIAYMSSLACVLPPTLAPTQEADLLLVLVPIKLIPPHSSQAGGICAELLLVSGPQKDQCTDFSVGSVQRLSVGASGKPMQSTDRHPSSSFLSGPSVDGSGWGVGGGGILTYQSARI